MLISQSQQILLDALKSSLFGIKVDFPENANWLEVLAEAKSQTVLGLVSSYAPIQDETVYHNKAFYMRIMYEQEKLVRLFEANSIPCVIIKGSSASMYYPKPYLRTMGDIDVLVSRKSFDDAMVVLNSNGYLLAHEAPTDGFRALGYSKNGVDIELHRSFSSTGFDIDDILEDAIHRREFHVLDGFKFPVLPDVENGLVLLGHINHHLKENSLGLRQIIDWEMFVHCFIHNSNNEDRFIALARRIGLMELALYLTRMCNDHLGLDNSFSDQLSISSKYSDDLLGVIMSDGNFGRRNMHPANHDEKNIINLSYGIERHGFFKYFTKLGMAKCKFVKKNFFTVAIAFIYGIIYISGKGIRLLFSKRKLRLMLNEGRNRYELYRRIGVK